ncbi:hypothetical protein ACFOEQ_06925 [Chryseobacterium arachidis]|uniref:hypothetical protein n=1 Tax=Chryseobacterium arachidis TaxID=1416778 RepID=UPI00361C909F
MEDIYFDQSLDNEQISNTLSETFPALTVFYWDFNNDMPEELDFDNTHHIFFNTGDGFGCEEFNFKISVYRTPDANHKEREFYLGKIFQISTK